jgi:Co/Zn/Cd efflux system component
LLNAELADERRLEIQRQIEADSDNRVVDLHVWRVGPRRLAATVSVVTHDSREPVYYKRLLSGQRDLVRVTIEVHRCSGDSDTPALTQDQN